MQRDHDLSRAVSAAIRIRDWERTQDLPRSTPTREQKQLNKRRIDSNVDAYFKQDTNDLL